MTKKSQSPIGESKDESKKDESKNEEPKKDLVSLYSEKIKELTSAAAGLAGLAYAFGFLIANINLNTRYGIYDFELLKSRYIYTGIFFVLFCFIALIGAFPLAKIIGIKMKSVFVKLGILTIMALIASGVYSLILKGFLVFTEGYKPDGLQSALGFPIAPWFTYATLGFAFQIWFTKTGGFEKRYGIPIPLSSSVFTILIFLAIIYALHYYPLWPVSLGGGKPIPVQMIADKDKVELVQQLVPIQGRNITEVVYLIEQSDKSYFVLVNHGGSISQTHPVEVSKSLIVGMIHPISLPPPAITYDRTVVTSTMTITSTVTVTPTTTVTATMTVTPTVIVVPKP